METTYKRKWYDFFLVPAVVSLWLFGIGSMVGMLPVMLYLYSEEPVAANLSLYASFWGIWAVFLLHCLIFKHNRPMLKFLTPKLRGNTWKGALMGVALGFGPNLLCGLIALAHGDIKLYFSGFQLLMLPAFLLVMVQSGAEELLYRGFLYQRLRRGYKSPWVAIVLNAGLFTMLHGSNDGVTPLALTCIFVIGVEYSLMVLYCDSFWMPVLAHTSWNFTQNFLLGLPNSGVISALSLFKADAVVGNTTFAYDAVFGIEGSLVALVLHVAITSALLWWGIKKKAQSTNIWAETAK